MMDFLKMSVREIADGVRSGKFTVESVLEFFIKRCDEYKSYNAIVEVFDDSLARAKALDARIKNGEKVGRLAGVPIAIKDNILYKGKRCGCASKFMQGFVAPYSATIVEKLEAEGAILFARTNMDEFAMGSSTEKSVYGACENAHDPSKVAGGSSGGSAVSVALGLCPVAIGTDTGGSVRQPSSFNGVVGIKPTYGTVSRYGIVAFASSTDQAAPIAKTAEDSEYVLSIMQGKDARDMTSREVSAPKKEGRLKIGLIKEFEPDIDKLEQRDKFRALVEGLKSRGAEIVSVSVKDIVHSLACYYIISPAEAASNLARFDGIKYARRSEKARTLEDVYRMSRGEGFGEEVKRRIMLGNFVLSSGYFDAYYKKAQALRAHLISEIGDALSRCTVILTPTTPGEAFDLGGKRDPISMYVEDLFTVPASLAKIPALSVPYARGESGLPLGVQIMGREGDEATLYRVAKMIEEDFPHGV